MEGDLHWEQLIGSRIAAKAGVQGGRDEPQGRARPLRQGNQFINYDLINWLLLFN